MVASPNPTQQNWIEWALGALEEQNDQYQKYEDYYVGDQPIVFATDKWVQTFGTVFAEFADNWCQVVVDSLVQRMEISGWKCEGEGGKEAVKRAEDIWDRNELGVEADDLHTQTAVKGDGFLIGWRDPDDKDRSQLYYNDALECQVYYDPSNRRRVSRAAKRYVDEKGQSHLILYFPNRTEKFFVPNDATPDQVASMMSGIGVMQDMDLPIGWARNGAPILNPYNRVPVFHFKNRNLGANNGLSEIASVIPIQNSINKLLMDMMVGSEFGSFRQKYVAGGGQPKDGWRVGGDRVWATTDPMAKFGEFGQIDLEPIFKAVEVMVGHVAKTSQTPMHYLRASGDVPSGEALKASESGLVKKAFSRQKQWGAVWSCAMTFALEVEGNKPENPVIPVWKSPETRHDLEQAQTAQLKAILGIPLKQLWSEHFNYTEEEVEDFEKQNLALSAAVLAQVVAQSGQLPPGSEKVTADPQAIIEMVKGANLGPEPEGGKGLNITQILALLGKGVTSQTAAGEATSSPQPNTTPPASPTRRSRGFKD